jgi:hypothetical protein
VIEARLGGREHTVGPRELTDAHAPTERPDLGGIVERYVTGAVNAVLGSEQQSHWEGVTDATG